MMGPHGSRLMPVVVDQVAREQPDLPYALIPLTENVKDGFKPVTFSEIANAVNRLAAWISTNIGTSSHFDTIAYMGLSDLRYVVVFLAAVKCGYKVLLPSLRNPAWMNTSLLGETRCSHVLYGPEINVIVRALLKEAPDLRAHQVPSLTDLILPGPGAEPYPFNKEYETAKRDPILVLHSSGSTGPPKPIQMYHSTFAVGDNDRNLPSVPGRVNQNWALWDFPKKEPFFSAFPAFHLAGFSSMIMLPIYYPNATLVLAPSARPPTGHTVAEMMDFFALKAIFCPPIIAEQLVQEQDGIEKCKSLKFLLYAGGPLSQAAGDALSSVTDVCQFYGQTETGPIQALVPRREDWASLEWHPMQEVIMEPAIDGTYEMVMKRNTALEGVRSLSCNFPDAETWHTKDLFKPHPTKPNLWTFHGRTDDIIVLSNGEKFNPVYSETHITAHPLLNGAIIIGQGFPQASLVLEPKEPTRDFKSLVDELWPTIEQANSQAPGHGRITKRMIICSSPSKPFDRTAKGTVMRSSTNKKYEKEISQLHEEGAANNAASIELTSLDLAGATSFVRDIIYQVFPGHELKDDDDFFDLGLNSLHIAELISHLKSGIRSGNPDSDVSWISTPLAYENPSINALAGSLLHHLDTKAEPIVTGGDRATGRVEKMEHLVQKYTQNLPMSHQAPFSTEHGIHVVLTGSTGSLGTQILARLLSDPNVTTIRCLDRSTNAKERVISSLASWSPPRAIDTSRVFFNQADYSKANWGLSASQASDLHRTANVIIHNAWKVDFNLTLDSFEAVHIAGIRNLLDLSAKCAVRPRVVFISSISTVIKWRDAGDTPTADASNPSPRFTVPEHVAPSLATAQPLGYAESKAVAERIIAAAAASSGLDASILRIGQIAGPMGAAVAGRWSAHEWFPLLLTTSKSLRMIPDGKALGQIDWVPSDVVASAVWDMVSPTETGATQTKSSPRVVHVVNPARRPWAELLPEVQARLGGKTVSMADWVAELENVDVTDRAAVAERPAAKILSFYRDMVQGPYLGIEEVVYATDRASALSPSLRGVGPVQTSWLARWMGDWGL